MELILTLKQARLLKEISQDKIAKELGIHVDTYRKIEKNPEIATIEQAKKISLILQLPYDFIFFSSIST